MFPFSTSILTILKHFQNDQMNFKNIDPNFSIIHEDNLYVISKLPDIHLNQVFTISDSLRYSTSYLPLSTRKDRFRDHHAYMKMYSYKGLIDTKHYPSIKLILKSIDNWDFNIFALERFTSGAPLTYLAIHLFEKYNLIKHFHLDISMLFQFLVTIERSYHQSNTYHNALHAADVTQAINCIIQDKQIFTQLSMLDILCSLISTICHDVDHPGLNNMFLINTNHYLSMLYKKLSVLENHHWAFSLSVLRESKLFSHFSKDMWNQVTDTCRNLIRATDISRQNAYIREFNETLLTKTATAAIPMLNEQEKLLVLQMAIKCADICNPCRRWDICNCWAYLVTEEFFQQGDKERSLSIPISPIMDRERSKQATVQKDFIKYLVLPLFTVWHQFINSNLSRNILELIDSNQKMWQQLSDFSNSEFQNIILSSVQSLYDRIQLMQVMDFTQDHQLSHLQQMLKDTKRNGSNELWVYSNEDSINLENNLNINSFHLYDLSETIDEGQTSNYQQYRRGSLPISLQLYNRESGFSSAVRKSMSSNRPKLMIRRTSLQPGQGYTTSFMTSISKTRNSSVQFATPTGSDFQSFPTGYRRKSAPAIKVNQFSLLETINMGRRGSLGGYICSNKLSSGLCSSQCQLYQPTHSMNDIQILQIG